MMQALIRSGARGASVLLVAGLAAACGIKPVNNNPEAQARLEALRETATQASQVGVLERQAYTRNSLLQFASAESDYRESVRLARSLFAKEPARAAVLRLHLALNKSNLGQTEAAEEIFQTWSRVVESIGAPSDRVKSDLFYSQHLMNSRAYADAEAIARRATDRLTVLIEQERSGGGNTASATLEVQPDGVLLLDDSAAALLNARVTREVDVDADQRPLAEEERLRLQRAHSYYITARSISAQGGTDAEIDSYVTLATNDLEGIPQAYGRWLRSELASLKADVLRARGDFSGAVIQLDAAVELLRRYEVNSRPEALLLFKQGELLIEAGRDAEAQAVFRDAVAIIQSSDQGIEAGQASTLVEQLLKGIERGEARAASDLFSVMQEVRSAGVAQTVAQLSARLSSGDSDRARLIREVQNLEREQNVLTARFDRLDGDPNADLHIKRVTESKLQETRAELERKQAELKIVAPNYDQLLGGTISLQQAQRAMKPGEVLAVIQLAEDSGYVGVLTENDFTAYPIEMTIGSAETAVEAFRAPIDGEFLLAFDVPAAYGLFETLFGPVADTVRGADHLIIVPSGPLTSLPFNTLVSEPYEEEIQLVDGYYFDYADVPFLIKDTAVTTGVSMSSFFLGRRIADSDAPKAFLGFGDFRSFGNNPEAVDDIISSRELADVCRDGIARLGTQVPELPGTLEELERVRVALNVPDEDVVLGAEFTDLRVKQLPLADYQVLHFATHGLLAQDPECLPEPGLITSYAPSGDTLLEASEIVALELDAALVVMSACDTSGGAGASTVAYRDAGGRYAKGGEDLGGLARSFFFAGARNVVASFWSVDDLATQQLMSGFYEAMADDRSVSIAEAMRRSQTSVIGTGELSHPFFWAPFATIGDGARSLKIGVTG